MTNRYFKMQTTSSRSADISIYGEITDEKFFESDVSAIDFQNELKGLGDVEEINVHINSPGGSVFAGVAIYNMLKNHPAKVITHNDGLSASISSVILMAGDKIIAPANSLIMIHNPWTISAGNSKDFRKLADDLDKIGGSIKQSYMSRELTISEEELSSLMDAETWLSAKDAFEMGFVDEVSDSQQIAASLTKEQVVRFKNAPTALTDSIEEKTEHDKKSIDKEYFDSVVDQLKNQIEELKKPKEEPAEPVKDNAMSAFFLNLN